MNRKGPGLGTGAIGSTFAGMVNGGKYTSATPRPVTVARPNRGDFGDPGARPMIGMPNRGDYGGGPTLGARSALSGAGRAVHSSAAGFNDPTSTAAFRNLMNLESEQGAAVEGEVARSARDAASRAGYSGGFGARSRQAQQDRFQAIAEGGMAAASDIRKSQLEKYNTDVAAQTSLVNQQNQQTGEADRAFAGDVSTTRNNQGQLDLGFGKLIQDRNLSYAEAQQEANRLQAQLDSAYQNQMIDAGRYNQISASVQAQLQAQQLKLKEDARQFDLTRKDRNALDARSQTELDKQRRERGVDAATGQHYGLGHVFGAM